MNPLNSPAQKRILVLRQLLAGRRYFDALVAMEFGREHHVGLRKDGVTPEFDHQVSIALYALTLPDLLYPQETMAVIMLHDIREDYGISDQEVRGLFRDPAFTDRVAVAVGHLTKTFRGARIADYVQRMGVDPIASIAKGCDRIHNLNSMLGVFSLEKQKDYVEESRERIIPMLKEARRRFPHQVAAYENIKWMLNSQISLIEAGHAALQRAD